MDCLIIVCLHSENHYVCLREGARRPAGWHQPELRAPFFWGEAVVARGPCAPWPLILRALPRSSNPGGSGRASLQWCRRNMRARTSRLSSFLSHLRGHRSVVAMVANTAADPRGRHDAHEGPLSVI